MGMDEVVFLFVWMSRLERLQTFWLALFGGPSTRNTGRFHEKWWFRVDLSACGRRRTLTILQKIVDNDWETSQKNASVEYVNNAK